jgi:hypothetical protein
VVWDPLEISGLWHTLLYDIMIVALVAHVHTVEVPQHWPECVQPLDLEDHVIAFERDHKKSKTNSSLSMNIQVAQHTPSVRVRYPRYHGLSVMAQKIWA